MVRVSTFTTPRHSHHGPYCVYVESLPTADQLVTPSECYGPFETFEEADACHDSLAVEVGRTLATVQIHTLTKWS